MKTKFDQNKNLIFSSLLAIMLFFGGGHHILNFWELPALKMIVIFALITPLLSLAVFFFSKWISPQVKKSNKGRLTLLVSSAVLVGILISLKAYRSPEAYHTLNIIPQLEKSEELKIVEIKADKSIVQVSDSLLTETGWKREGNLIVATINSQPLKVTFQSKANTPVIVLFSAFPQGGEADLIVGRERGSVNTEREGEGETKLTLVSQYRGLPNWLFTTLLALADVLFFSSLIFVILLIQEKGMDFAKDTPEKTPNHKKKLLILLSITLALHLFNLLTTPLILDVDTPSYLSGAIHWIKNGNLAGTNPARGIGSTFLFTPILLIFGRNPWGMKVFLHLFAIACVPLAYKVGWQLTGKSKVAFLSGFFAMLTPDLMLYANYLWSDLINLTFVMFYLSALLSTLEKPDFKRILITSLIAALATLFRTENLTLFPIGFFFLILKAINQFDLKKWGLSNFAWRSEGLGVFRAKSQRAKKWKNNKKIKEQKSALAIIRASALSLIIGILPLILAAYHNRQVHGFMGLSNYAGAVFYDGWIYFGDASKLNFSNQDSNAIKEINAAREKYPPEASDKTNVATSIETSVSLKKAGYTTEEIMALYTQAVFDSITNDWALTLKLLEIKIIDGLSPFTTHVQTFPLPGEAPNPGSVKERYYDLETLSIPSLIKIQREFNDFQHTFYQYIYPYLIWAIIPSLFFAFFRKPSLLWLTFITITITRIFIPLIMGASLWRFALAGLIPLEISGITWYATLILGIRLKAKQS